MDRDCESLRQMMGIRTPVSGENLYISGGLTQRGTMRRLRVALAALLIGIGCNPRKSTPKAPTGPARGAPIIDAQTEIEPDPPEIPGVSSPSDLQLVLMEGTRCFSSFDGSNTIVRLDSGRVTVITKAHPVEVRVGQKKVRVAANSSAEVDSLLARTDWGTAEVIFPTNVLRFGTNIEVVLPTNRWTLTQDEALDLLSGKKSKVERQFSH